MRPFLRWRERFAKARTSSRASSATAMPSPKLQDAGYWRRAALCPVRSRKLRPRRRFPALPHRNAASPAGVRQRAVGDHGVSQAADVAQCTVHRDLAIRAQPRSGRCNAVRASVGCSHGCDRQRGAVAGCRRRRVRRSDRSRARTFGRRDQDRGRLDGGRCSNSSRNWPTIVRSDGSRPPTRAPSPRADTRLVRNIRAISPAHPPCLSLRAVWA